MPNREGTSPVLGLRGAKYLHYSETGSVDEVTQSRLRSLEVLVPVSIAPRRSRCQTRRRSPKEREIKYKTKRKKGDDKVRFQMGRCYRTQVVVFSSLWH